MESLLIKIIRIGRRTWESAINDDTEKHRLIGNTVNIGNKFMINVEPNLNSYFKLTNELYQNICNYNCTI